MVGKSYRLQSDSIAIRTSGAGDRCTVTIPAGEIATVLEGPIGARRVVEVDWKGESVFMFADDLQHSEASFFSEARTLDRGACGNSPSTGPQGREQALIEHSMDLAEANEELERFAFAAAHDLREPLRSIHVMIERFLQRNGGTLDGESAQMLDFVLNNTKRMARLIHDLLVFATGSYEADIGQIDTKAIAELARQQLSQAIEQTGATIAIESLPMIYANEEQFLRLFQNLIGNAIKYRGEARPAIRISASMNSGEWTFSVSDNGIGIEPKYHEQIFAPFRRLHGGSKYEGTGVGLAICKRAVEQLNGRIWVESEPGQGSTFYFTIPATSPESSGDEGIRRKPTQTSEHNDGKIRASAP